jgi:hypothetical protein
MDFAHTTVSLVPRDQPWCLGPVGSRAAHHIFFETIIGDWQQLPIPSIATSFDEFEEYYRRLSYTTENDRNKNDLTVCEVTLHSRGFSVEDYFPRMRHEAVSLQTSIWGDISHLSGITIINLATRMHDASSSNMYQFTHGSSYTPRSSDANSSSRLCRVCISYTTRILWHLRRRIKGARAESLCHAVEGD